MQLFDAHCHLDDEHFDEDREKLIEEIFEAGVTKLISAGYNLNGSKNSLKLSKKYDFIYSTVGISPNDLNENYLDEIAEIERILEENKNENFNNKKLVAIGEIGLDYHYDTDKDIQKDAFIKQIELANKYNLPIVIHTRDAVMDTLEILKTHPVKKTGIFHCCPFNRELVKEALNLGYNISICGPVTFKNSKNAEEIVNMIPLDRFTIETDSPYLAPEPVRGTRNDPRNVLHIAQKIADFRGLKIDEIASKAYSNACRIFDINM